MSACPKGGEHVPAFPATTEGNWLIHRCKKCDVILDRRPKGKARRAVRAAALVLFAAAAGLVTVAWIWLGTAS